MILLWLVRLRNKLFYYRMVGWLWLIDCWYQIGYRLITTIKLKDIGLLWNEYQLRQ